ncbi:MAG: hypothetical protein HQM13_12845 [SAR324 cluster bacterium]|nr:hypothetical protein [SAR324 cluster bacterium]
MNGFPEYIKNTYNLPISFADQEAINRVSSEELESLKKKIERKYKTAAQILTKFKSPILEKTIELQLEKSPAICLRAFSRVEDLLQLWSSDYLDDILFDKYHQKVVGHSETHAKLLDLVHQAQEQSFEPEDFRQYLASGLFDEGIYTMKRGPSPAEVKKLLEAMRLDIYKKYQLTLCKKDEEFVLYNKVRNPHIVTQIVVPKYRIASEIIDLLAGHYLDDPILKLLEMGLNDGVPILKRIKALAEWYAEGYLSQTLVKKYHLLLVHDLDELEAFFRFLENISELISKNRAIHYMELGLYEVFEEDFLSSLLKLERCLYDISDYFQDSVREYIQIMKTPAASKSLNTNRRLAQCFGKFINAAELLIGNCELLEIKKYLPRLRQYQSGLSQLFQDYHSKNPSLPAPPPFKAIEFIRPFSKMYFNIECETMLRMSTMLTQSGQKEFQKLSESDDPVLLECAKHFRLRVQVVQEALANPKDYFRIIGQLLPMKQTHMFELDQYLNKKK